MGAIKVPYLVPKASGFYWEPGPKLRARGYTTVALGKDEIAAAAHAKRLNDETKRDRFKIKATIPYSVSYLFAKYLDSERFKTRAPATQREYKRLLTILEEMKIGERRFGDFQAGAVRARHADAIHERVKKNNGLATANSMCRTAMAVWKWGIRKEYVRGITHDQNPFWKMQLPTLGQREQIWMPDQVQTFVEKCLAEGIRSMALATRLAYDGGIPEGDILGEWTGPKRKKTWNHGLFWPHYKNGAIRKKRNKTGINIFVPVPVYPELQSLLETMRKPIGPMVVCEATGRPWTADFFRHEFRRVARLAGIPDDLQFRDLRATATTELLDADANEMQTGSHVGLSTTQMIRRYGRRTEKQAAAGALKRKAARTKAEEKSETGSEGQSEKKNRSNPA